MKLSWIYLALAATAMAEEDERGQKVKKYSPKIAVLLKSLSAIYKCNTF